MWEVYRLSSHIIRHTCDAKLKTRVVLHQVIDLRSRSLVWQQFFEIQFEFGLLGTEARRVRKSK